MVKNMNRTASALALTAAVGLAGCGPLGLQLNSLFGGHPSQTSASSTQDSASPPFQPAANQLSQVSAGILVKNSSKLSGTIFGPAGIIVKNSSKYEIESVEQEVPLAGAWVYLETTDGLYVADPNGKPYIAQSDSSGDFSFDEGVPAGQEYVLEAFTATGDYLLANFAYTQPGETNVQIDLASTCASDYLHHQVMAWNRSLSQLDFTKLPGIIGDTRSLIDSGTLSIDDSFLLESNRDQLVSTYAAALANDASLTAEWNAFLGPAPASTPTPAPLPSGTPSGAQQTTTAP